MKYLRSFALICILGVLYSSCTKKENYPDYPVITFNSFTPFCSGSTTDSAYLTVNFTDGNGAIGYPAQQQGAPVDFYIEPLVYNSNTNTYDSIVPIDSVRALTLNYLIPDITPTGSDKELSGLIQINLEGFFEQDITSIYFPASDGFVYYQLKFKVWMYDRNGNRSNVLTTPTVYTCH